MKFIHLSDLHIGKRVNDFSMIEDQRYILKQIVDIIKDKKPDAVLIAGDVYDKPAPSAEAVQLFDDFISELADMDLELFIISGNHDSAERLSFGSRIMDKRGIHFAGGYDGKTHMFSLEDEFGISKKLVITDRLHGAISCAISSTPCIVLPNCYHKIKSFMSWMRDLPC